MKRYETKDLRNVVLLGHSGSGKTSLVEAMLLCAKAVTRPGRVDDGSSNLDTEPEEVKRRITIHAHAAWVEWGRTRINLLDAPGDPDFSTDARGAALAADAALVAVSAPDGVQVGTEKAWAIAEQAGLPAAIVVTKLDRERADFDAALEQCRTRLTDKAAPLQIPIGAEHAFEGVVDLLSMKAWRFPGDGLRPEAGDVPAGLRDAAQAARDKLIEAVAATEDALIEKYLESGELSDEEVRRGLVGGIAKRAIVPVLCGSGTANRGVQPLLDLLRAAFPAPAARPPVRGRVGEQEATRRADDGEPLSARVFKSIPADVGRINLVRVVSGVLKADSTVHNASRGVAERVGQIYLLQGKKRETVPEAGAGDIVGLAKLKDTHTGDTLCDEKAPIVFPAPEPVPAVLAFAIRTKSRGDEDKLGARLRDLCEEDPALRVVREQSTNEMLLTGTGQVHLEANVEKLRRLGVDVELLPPKIPYRETVKGRVQNVEGKHKKQTGGRGQFGVCYVNMEPLPRGTGFEFADEIFGGAIPRQFIPAVEKGVRDRMGKGVIAGYPVVDVKVSLIDGKYHEVDSDGRSFEMAGSRAFQAAVRDARPVLLEPIMNLEVTCPDDHMGDVMGDINSRRGRVLGMDAGDGAQIIKAQVPQAEVVRYALDLRSMTGGRGSFTLAFSHYEEVPGHIADKIIANAKVAEEEE